MRSSIKNQFSKVLFKLTSLYMSVGVVLICEMLTASTVYAENQHLFGAPAANQTTSSSSAGSLSQVTLALAIVLIVVFAAAWFMRRLRKLGQRGDVCGIEIVAQAALGSKERAVLLKVGDAHVLVGVAPGQVRALHVMTLNAAQVAKSEDTSNQVINDQPVNNSNALTAQATMPSFKALLKQSLGLRS